MLWPLKLSHRYSMKGAETLENPYLAQAWALESPRSGYKIWLGNLGL